MAFYSYIFSANYKKFFETLKQISKKENKNYIGLVLDAGYSVFRYGLGLSDYTNFKFYNRNRKERKEYVGTRLENKFYETVSPSAYKKRYTIKYDFLEDFKEFTKRDFIVPNEENYEQYLRFLEKHDVFMSKPYDGLAGKDVKKEYTKEINDKKEFFQNCIANRIFLEELVIQHQDLNKLCAKSVNTMRIMTFNDNGKPRIIWMGLRVGNGVNSIDNFHAKGMGVNIDINTGKLVGNAIDKDLNEYVEHPTSHIKFDGFQIPCFEEAKQMVLKASLKSDKILVVGWDVAISENGPVIIEGNRRPGFDLVQVLSNRGRKDIIRDVLKDVETHDSKITPIASQKYTENV